jgi:hypothetical protein
VPNYVYVPILLVLMSVALTALIYWGGAIEEKRHINAAKR